MSKKLTAVIVDDERLARNALRTLINELGSVDIVGEADSVVSAIVVIEKEQPDVVFLDIQMPGESGFDLLEKISTGIRIIFVTAFDEYALRAFEVNALDYLMKPVSPARLREAVERLSEKPDIAQASKQKLTSSDRLFLLFNTSYAFIKISSITHISSSGDYSEVHLDDGRKGLTNKSMQEWENRLPADSFCRIHRSTIINLDCIVKIDEWFNQAFRVQVKGSNEPFIMSRRYASVIKGRFS